jgi:hypothetical protein
MSQNHFAQHPSAQGRSKNRVDAQQCGNVKSHVKADKSPIDNGRHLAAQSSHGALTAGDAGDDVLTKI